MISSQETAFRELQEAVFDLKQENETLLRFLKVNGYNAKKAEAKLRKSVKWFKDNRVGTYLHQEFSPAVIEDYVMELVGDDNDGHPVFYMPIGGWSVKKMIESGYLEESLQYRFHLLERLMEAIDKSQKSKFVMIMDMAGLTYKKCAHYETMYFLGQAFRDFEENFPERLRACYIINAPWAFSYVYNTLKHVFSSRTINKAKIFDSNQAKWRKVLTERIPEKSFPSCYKLYNEQEASS